MNNFTKNELIAEMGRLFFDSFEIILDAAHLGIWEWNTSTNELIYVDSSEHITGQTFSSPFIDTTVLKTFVPLQEYKKIKILAGIFLSDKSDRYEARFKLKRTDGRLIWCEAKGRTIEYLPDGTPLRVMGVIQDIQGAMSLFKKDEMLKAVNSVASLLMLSDGDELGHAVRKSLEIIAESVETHHIYIYKNHKQDDILRCSKICEWPYDDKDSSYDEIFPRAFHPQSSTANDVSYAEYFPEWEQHLSAGKYINSSLDALQSPLKDFPPFQNAVSILIIPIIIQEEFWGFIGFDDYYEERIFTETERDILKSGGLIIASALQRSEMTNNLLFAKEIALESTMAKNTFLANMSHEIHTPMNAIVGMTTIARNSDDMKRIKACLHSINKASLKLVGIVNDLLDMAKYEIKQFELAEDEFNFRKIVRSIYNIHLNRLNENNQKFYVLIDKNVPKWLIGDASRLSQVIDNLMVNAINFTPESGVIKLYAKEISSDDEYSEIELKIEDNGMAASSKPGKMGLGTAVSKNIVEQMGGTLMLDASETTGCLFTFSLRLKKGSGLKDSKNEIDVKPDDFDFSRKHLLLVDDIEVNLAIVASLLEATHVNIDTASNGLEAYKMFIEAPNRYDLIYMDLQMPLLNGYEATEKIRASAYPSAKTIPIVALTANAFTEDIENCIKAGMDDHLAKPVDLHSLLSMTNHFLSK